MEPLVKCLPSDLFSIDEDDRVVLQKPIDSKLWDTLFEYLFRVHSITITQTSIPSAVIEHLNLLMLASPSTTMSWFPNLHKLTWHANGTRIFAPILRMALVPSMLVLNVEISLPPDYTFLSVLSSLGALCPYLQNMTFRIRHESEDLTLKSLPQISPFIAQPMSQLHHLHTLSIWDAGSEVLELVMKLRAIQSLSLDLRASSAWGEKPRFQSPGFDCLKWFNISTRTIWHASNFFSSLRVVKSKQIKVDVASTRTRLPRRSQLITEFFAILQERCDHDILEYLSLSIGHSKGLSPKPSDFTPLRAFSNLTHLLIAGTGNISNSDEGLCQLAKALPKLQVLKINETKLSTQLPTFHGLINLIWCCPALTSLALAIDTTESEGIDPKCPGSGRCNKRLKCLALENSTINDPVNVALIISGLFPSLEQVDLAYWGTFYKDKMDTMSPWVIVNNVLHGFRVARERRVESWSDCL